MKIGGKSEYLLLDGRFLFVNREFDISNRELVPANLHSSNRELVAANQHFVVQFCPSAVALRPIYYG